LIKSKDIKYYFTKTTFGGDRGVSTSYSFTNIKNQWIFIWICRNNKLRIRETNLQTTQPPYSHSGALTTRVNRITIGLPRPEESPAAIFLPGPTLSIQFEHCQSPSGMHSKSKQAATKTSQAETKMNENCKPEKYQE
jgi:hypothetical protein